MRKITLYRLLRAFSAVVVTNFFVTFFLYFVYIILDTLQFNKITRGVSLDFGVHHFLCVFLISVPWAGWILFFEKEKEKKFLFLRWLCKKWKEWEVFGKYGLFMRLTRLLLDLKKLYLPPSSVCDECVSFSPFVLSLPNYMNIWTYEQHSMGFPIPTLQQVQDEGIF